MAVAVSNIRQMLYGFIAIFGLLFAMFIQLFYEYYPCPLCILQRYLYVGIALASIIDVVLGRHLAKYATALALLLASISSAAGMFHVYVQFFSTENASCGADTLELFLNDLPFANALPNLFMATGNCSDPTPLLFGVDMVIATLIASISMLVLCVLILKNKS